MSTLREAAQQALDRLRMYYYGTGFAEDAECIAALERALARKQAEPTGKQSLQVDHGLNMNTPQAAQRLLDAIAAAMLNAPHCGEFDIMADAADDLRAALKREEEALAPEFRPPAVGRSGLERSVRHHCNKGASVRTDNLVREMAHTWVDGGGDEDGISYCLHQLRQAVRDEVQRRADAERARVELNEQVQKWEADLQARANACW